jgi:cytochrome b561
MIKTIQRYNTVAIILHWVTALLILYMLIWGEGLIKDQHSGNPPIKALDPTLHVSLGLLILILTFARLAWRWMNPPPADVPMPVWQTTASHALHWAFYAMLILIPLTGIADLQRVINGKHPEFASLTFFNLFPMPHFSMPWFGHLHGLLTNLMWALLGLHVVAALMHQFIDKDKLINRMLPH